MAASAQGVYSTARLPSFYCSTIFLPSLTLCNTSSFFTRSVQLISILLQHHVWKRNRRKTKPHKNCKLSLPRRMFETRSVLRGTQHSLTWRCHCRVHNSPQLVLILSRFDPVRTLTYQFETHLLSVYGEVFQLVSSLNFFSTKIFLCFISGISPKVGAWGSVVVKALRYKSEGPGIDSRCRRGFFPWHLTVPCALR